VLAEENKSQGFISLNSRLPALDRARMRLVANGDQRNKERAMSNQIDRFGRIAFNKNQNLSQASL